jgi:single-strand DNA-binding protein
MSSTLNSILIDGNLTRDPELKTTPKGTKVCKFGLASNRFYELNEERVQEVSFFDVESWARLGEACAEHLKKGRGVRVIGRLKQDRWQNEEGQNRSRVKIVAEHIVFKPQIKRDGDGVDGELEEGVEYSLEGSDAQEPALL